MVNEEMRLGRKLREGEVLLTHVVGDRGCFVTRSVEQQQLGLGYRWKAVATALGICCHHF